MNWELFIARRIHRSKDEEKEVSKPAVLIAMWGISIGLAVMIIAVAVVVGFKHQVRNKVVGVGADITVTNFDIQKSYETVPVFVGDSLLQVFRRTDGVKHVQRYSTKPGMIMTVEPGIYIPGFGGVRIEDDIIVTEDGCKVLNNYTKELQVI